jgi:hypothetical protein
MIFAYDHQRIIMTEFQVKQVWQQHIIVTGCKIEQKMNQNWPDLLWDGSLILHNNACPQIAKVVADLLSKYKWGSVTSRAIWCRHESTRLWLIPQVKRDYAWTPFSLPGRGFGSSYPSHPRTEQKRYPKLNSKSSATLGRGHWEAEGQHRRTVKRYFLK